MTQPTTLAEAAEEHVVHVSKNTYACPSCGEETLWHAATDDFKAGASFQREQILALLRSEDFIQYGVNCLNSNEEFSPHDWLEKKLAGDK